MNPQARHRAVEAASGPGAAALGTPEFPGTGSARALIVGIADCKMALDPGLVIVTQALGSCVGVVLWNRTTQVGGMLHAMLPDSTLDPERARLNPYVFVDTGLRRLVEWMRSRAGSAGDLVVKVAGGASLLGSPDRFRVGVSNVRATQTVIEEAGLRIHARDTGGTGSRTIQFHLSTGLVSIRRGSREVGVL